MQIVGVEAGGRTPVLGFPLAHGDDPYQVLWERGYRVIRPLSVSGTDNKVRVDTVGRVDVEGTSNSVLWRHGLAGAKKPKVSSAGVNNKVAQAPQR